MVVCYRKKGDKYLVIPHTTFDGIATSVFQFWYYTGKIVFTCNSNYVGGNTMGTEKYKVVIASGQVKLPAQYPEFENMVEVYK